MRSGRPRIRSLVVALAVTAISVAGAVTVLARTTTAQAAAPPATTVEDDGANCAVTLPGSLTANAKLPDPFKRLNGTAIAAKSDWRCRREEIKRLAETYVYGAKPARPASVTGTVTRTSVTVNVSDSGHSASFSATISLPSGTGPFPAVVLLGGIGADTATILASGAAVINYNQYAVGAEGTPRNNKQGAFYSIYGATSSTGLLVAWAWGVSRIIDVIAQSDGTILRADAMGVTGCSRFGKGAIVAGAFDQRIALTMPIESGSAGVPIFRGIPGEGAQSLSSAFTEQPWLGDAFGSFTGNPGMLPVDTHELVAMVAPRGLFIMDNPFIANLGPRSASVAALGGAEVYKALGAGDNVTYWSDIQDGNHCDLRPEWKTPLQQNIQKFLLRTGNSAGVIRISSRAAGNLADWRDWSTPTLSDGPSAPPSSTPPSSAPPSSAAPSSPPPSSAPPSSPPPSSAPPTGGCAVTLVAQTQWATGYVIQPSRVTNTGTSTTSGWTVTVTLPSGHAVTGFWNATESVSGQTVTFHGVSFNSTLAPGASGEFGFQASRPSGDTALPTATCSVA